MKGFLKIVFGTMVGIALWCALVFIIGIVSLIGMSASETATSPVKKGSVLRINLNGTLDERATTPSPIDMLMGGGNVQSLALDQLLDAIDEAATNDKVKGIYIEVGDFAGGTPATMQELRQALVKFKKDFKKWIVAHGDQYNQGAYYVASVADQISMNPEGIADWHGLASVPMFMADAAKKLGVKFQVFKVGTYKSAVEPYILTEMSPANREQVTSFLGSVWENMVKEVGASRKLSAEQLNALADSMITLQPQQASVDAKLIDKLYYIDEFKADLRKRLDLKDGKEIPFVSPADLAAAADKESSKNKIAVYYAVGDIVDEPSQMAPLQGGASIVTMPTLRELQKLRKDEDVKAVVLRVNSPGGSAFASEQIWREIQLLKKEKPVVVSMGGYAASGGYYISCGANKIVAEPTTLTGSIGIFGLIPEGSELLEDKIGLHFDVVKTNKYADFGGAAVMGIPARPFSADEAPFMQAMIERGYDLFTKRVAAGRGISQDSVDAIGQGRVWTGEQAIKLGLVDKLGNLDDAIEEAAKLAELGDDYACEGYPAEKPWFESLMEQKQESYFDEQARQRLGILYPFAQTLQRYTRPATIKDCVYARIPFELGLQ